jgi:O-antigen ligase
VTAPSPLAPAYEASVVRIALVSLSFIGAAVALLVEPIVAPLLLMIPTVVVAVERSRRDAVTVLSGIVVCLTLIPAGQVIGPLGAAGRPASVLGLVALWWWLHTRLLEDGGVARGFQPVRLATLLLLAALLLSEISAFTRPGAGIEISSVDRGILFALGLCGALLLAADGIDGRERLDVLLRRVVAGATFVAGIGLLQFFVGVDLSGVFDIPGLAELDALQGIQNRSDFNRVAATATHPIEFGVVLAMVFPIAVHYALQSRRLRDWTAVGIIALGIPMSVSRAGILALGVSALCMWFTWPRSRKINSAVIAVVFTGLVRLAVPGLVGTLRSLFTNIFLDDSVEGRTSDYPRVGGYIVDSPFIGRGFGTFTPDRYLVLDNQYLGMLIETGIVGAVAFLGLLVTGICVARGSRIGGDDATRSLGQALAAAIAACMVAAVTFDLMGFGMVTMLLFLLIGCAGALWRLTERERAAARAARASRWATT